LRLGRSWPELLASAAIFAQKQKRPEGPPKTKKKKTSTKKKSGEKRPTDFSFIFYFI
jgi:hypothetical protein